VVRGRNIELQAGDRLIVAMTFAAYIAWLGHPAFTQVLPSRETADEVDGHKGNFKEP
jgi:hypothetical protein